MANRSLPPLDDELRLAHSREHVERPAGIRGGFRLSLESGRWWWSPGMYELLGYRSGHTPAPSTQLLLGHRHPLDRAMFERAWRHLVADGGVVAIRYRIIGVDDRVRPVFAMAYRDDTPEGRPLAVSGVIQSDGPAR